MSLAVRRRGALAVALGAIDDHVGRHPAAVDVDAGHLLARAAAARQIADVAVAGQHLEIGAEILVDRLGLGRRFDDDQILFVLGAVRRGRGGRLARLAPRADSSSARAEPSSCGWPPAELRSSVGCFLRAGTAVSLLCRGQGSRG